jgi:hypothetical protein
MKDQKAKSYEEADADQKAKADEEAKGGKVAFVCVFVSFCIYVLVLAAEYLLF